MHGMPWGLNSMPACKGVPASGSAREHPPAEGREAQLLQGLEQRAHDQRAQIAHQADHALVIAAGQAGDRDLGALGKHQFLGLQARARAIDHARGCVSAVWQPWSPPQAPGARVWQPDDLFRLVGTPAL